MSMSRATSKQPMAEFWIYRDCAAKLLLLAAVFLEKQAKNMECISELGKDGYILKKVSYTHPDTTESDSPRFH